MKEFLDLRNKIKLNKPKFVRKDSNKEKNKNRYKWRKPKGLHNKRRLKKKGHQKNPSTGYKSPRVVKSLHVSGLSLTIVNNLLELKALDHKKQLAVISSKLGIKKKIKVLEYCLDKKIDIYNFKDITLALEKFKAKLDDNKKLSKKRKDKKKKEQEKLTKEEKKKEEKKESKGKKQEKVKKEILSSKQKINEKPKEEGFKRDTTQSKSGHTASSVPGTKQ